MKTHGELPSFFAAKLELNRLHDLGMLDVIEDENSLGMLRGVNGNRNLSLLNATFPRAKIAPFFSSQALLSTLFEFDMEAARLLGKGYILKGYVGLTAVKGALTYLHNHHGVQGAANVVISGGREHNASTMFYNGRDPISDLEGKQMHQVVDEIGIGKFVQAAEGQVTEFGSEDFHGEPILPERTPRLLLVAYSYE
jgi:hypothetical protein